MKSMTPSCSQLPMSSCSWISTSSHSLLTIRKHSNPLFYFFLQLIYLFIQKKTDCFPIKYSLYSLVFNTCFIYLMHFNLQMKVQYFITPRNLSKVIPLVVTQALYQWIKMNGNFEKHSNNWKRSSNNYYIRQFAMENYDQTNLDQEHPIKVKTPAALFSKSSGKSPINRLRMQPSPSQQSFLENHCENHPNKSAAFFTKIDSQKLYFCQKCAITLASQGHGITKVQQNGTNLFTSPTQSNSSAVKNSHSRSRSGQSYSRNPRELQIQSFIQQVKEMRGSIVCTKETIKQKLIQSQQFYGQQLQEINQYFSLIIKSLELQKHKCYNHILTERQQAEQHIRNIAAELTSIDQGLTKIQIDIQDNLQTVYSIEQDMYKLVFSQYLSQQQDFQQSINGLLLQPIEMRKIQFQGVPQSIFNISDVVIQSSVKNQQNIQYRLADSLTGSDFNHITVVSPEKGDWRCKVSESRHSNLESLKFSFEAQRLKGHESGWKQDSNNLCY